MSRRLLVILILIVGAAVAIFLFKKESAPVRISATAEQENSATTSSSTVANNQASDKTVHDRAVSSSGGEEATTFPAVHPGRGRFSTLRGKRKSVDIQGANTRDNEFLQGTSWKIWAGVAAYPKAAGEPTSGRVLGELSGFYLVEDGLVADTGAFTGQPIGVIDPASGTAGVLTGTFTVLLEEGASADFLQSPDIKIIGAFPEIYTYYVTSAKAPFDLKAFQEALRSAPEVKQVTPEILSRQYEKF